MGIKGCIIIGITELSIDEYRSGVVKVRSTYYNSINFEQLKDPIRLIYKIIYFSEEEKF